MGKIWKPHCYQRTAISFLLTNKRGGLFLDPGLGKTSISLRTIKFLKLAEQIRGVLLIAPMRVAYSVWDGEIDKWDNFKGLSTTILHGKTKPTLWGEQKDIYLINPEGLPWLHQELLDGLGAGKQCPFDVLWIDESTKFKSATSARFKLLKDMLPLFSRRHIMTGTPATKSLMDLWSQMFILDDGDALGSNFYKFRKTYFHANDWNKYSWIPNEFSAQKIQRKMAHLVLEMSAEDHLDMPELVFNNIRIVLPAKALTKYKKMEQDFFLELDENEITAEASAQASGKCHQLANGAIYEDVPKDLTDAEIRKFKRTRKTLKVHDAKATAIKDLVEELNGKPLLVAYHFKHDLEALKKTFGADLPYIGSGVAPEEAKRLEKLWNEGKLPILAGHPDSMGHGLNLQKCGNDICWYSLTWNLENYLQFIARIWRQGVSGQVRIHHLVAESTVDEAMLIRLGERAKDQQDLRDAIKQYRKQLSIL